ncbi:MAG: phosphotransferase [Propionibacteriales bacterium]|nr:phosphotransferase [Propionibacteriales bacterium]
MENSVCASDTVKPALEAVRPHLPADTDLTSAEVRQLSGGWSRHSYVVTTVDRLEQKREFVVRVRPSGALLETDIGVEYRTYQMVSDEPIPVPRVYGYEDSADNPFGGPFFVMDKLDGWAPSTWQRDHRELLERNWATSRSIAEDLLDILHKIHSVPVERCEGVLPRLSYVDVVRYWLSIYEGMRLVRDPIVEEAFSWLLDRVPVDEHLGLVHGDYRIGNTLIADDRIAGVLDWELAFVGDTRFDLGYMSLEYLAGKFLRKGSRLLCGTAAREWFMAEYQRRRGVSVDDEVVRTYSVMGALMLITILLTGIRYFHDGSTSDIRMAWGRFAIPGLRQDLVHLMGW